MSRYAELSVDRLVMPATNSIHKSSVLDLSLTPVAVAAAIVAEQVFTVSGLRTNDRVTALGCVTGNATGITTCRVSAADTLAVSFVNPTVGILTPGAGTYSFFVLRGV